MKKKKLWFRVEEESYSGDEPAFFDSSTMEWSKLLTENAELIKEELREILESENSKFLKPYFEKALQSTYGGWKTDSFYFWAWANFPFIERFPKTNAILKQIPGLVTASVNLLEPHSEIKAHYGDTNAIYRCHFGLKIPASLPDCGFKVKDETRSWGEGKLLIFTDAYRHEAFNHSSGKRYILQLDVLRPEFRNRKHFICSRVLGLTIVQGFAQKLPIVGKYYTKHQLLFPPIIWLAQVYVALRLYIRIHRYSTQLLN